MGLGQIWGGLLQGPCRGTRRGLNTGVGRASSVSSAGLSPLAAALRRRGENVEAEAKLWEAVERRDVQKADAERTDCWK